MAHVQVDDLFHVGYEAHARGLAISDCPYPPNSHENRLWRDGWSQARFADKDENVHDAPGVLRSARLHRRRR